MSKRSFALASAAAFLAALVNGLRPFLSMEHGDHWDVACGAVVGALAGWIAGALLCWCVFRDWSTEARLRQNVASLTVRVDELTSINRDLQAEVNDCHLQLRRKGGQG